MKEYTVQKGDTLYGISKQFGISIDDIKKQNNLTSNTLEAGQVLQIRENQSPTTYTVKKGDDLYSIAQKFGTTVDQIKGHNNLTSNLLSIGQVLKVKVGEETVGIEECFGEGYEELGKRYLEHTVIKGDSIYSIARNYNTTVDNIIKLNNLKNTNLSLGQVLKIKEIS